MYFDHVVGVDLGGTKILTSLADISGTVHAEIKVPSGASEGPQRVIERIVRTVSAVQQQCGADPRGLVGMAVAAPGQVDIKRGFVHFAPNLGWHNIPLKEVLENKLNVHVTMENDANTAALGELIYGAGRGNNDLVYITVSTGVGGGIIFDGNIFHGASDSAGEIGHMVIMPDGPLCSCGNNGCLEALASGTAIARAAYELVASGQGDAVLQAAGGRREAVDARAVAKAAQKGDQQARAILAGAARALGIGIANVVNILNPPLVVLGGGVMAMKDLMWPLMEKEMRARALKASIAGVRVLPAELENRSGVMGAVALAIRRLGN